jgi:hypothetical protein
VQPGVTAQGKGESADCHARSLLAASRAAALEGDALCPVETAAASSHRRPSQADHP